jgi:hypothetical protein
MSYANSPNAERRIAQPLIAPINIYWAVKTVFTPFVYFRAYSGQNLSVKDRYDANGLAHNYVD